MYTHALEHVPVFEALSYAWVRQVFHYIGCDGSSVRIQDSLWLALQRLGHETNERVLWVDAICQSNGRRREK